MDPCRVAAAAAVLLGCGLGASRVVGLGAGGAVVLLVAAAAAGAAMAWRAGIRPTASSPRATLALGVLGVACVVATTMNADDTAYHLPLVAALGHAPSLGSDLSSVLLLDFRPDGYPLDAHALMAVVAKLSGGYAAMTLVSWVALSWLVVQAAALVRPTRALAPLVGLGLLGTPGLLETLGTAPVDLLAAAALLALAAEAGRREPSLVLAAGLAGLCLGTKTTTLVPAVALLAVAAVRGGRPRAAVVAAATGVALLSGGHWLLADLIRHGSPLWPQLALPGGDPVPRYFTTLPRFADDPVSSFGLLEASDRDRFGLGTAAFAAGLAFLAVRRRSLRVPLALLVLGSVAWAFARQTGKDVDDGRTFVLASVAGRYYAPVVIAAAGLLAARMRRDQRTVPALLAVLGAGNALSLVLGGLVELPVLTLVAAACAVLVLPPPRRMPALPAGVAPRLAALVLLVVAVVAVGRSSDVLWRRAVERSVEPTVVARRACLLTHSCLLRSGTRVPPTWDAGARLGPQLAVDVRIGTP